MSGTGTIVDPTDPNIVYAGMGETTIRIDVSHGDGVYKSNDAGRTWKHLGLVDTRHIGRVRVHPKNSDIVYVAALGHAFGPNEERGVFRSKDGGTTWEQLTNGLPNLDATDLAITPGNPSILYAAIFIHEVELARGATVPHTALTHAINLLQCHLA